VKNRVATHLEKPGNLKAVREVRKIGSQGKCVLAWWSITKSIVLGTKYVRKEFFTS